jgi:hypothetical protein
MHRCGIRGDPAIFVPYLPEGPAGIQLGWTLCRSGLCARSRARRTFNRTATEALRKGIPHSLSPLWTGRQLESKPGSGMSPRITLSSKRVPRQVTLMDLPPHGSR